MTPLRAGLSPPVTQRKLMKNATKHAEELKSLLKRLLKESKPEARQSQEPLRALVRGAMSFDVSDARAAEIMQHIDKEFVDLNELRVATDLEIQELLGARYPAIERRVTMITQSLNRIFEKEHTLSLDRMKTISKRESRQFLRELPDMNPFVEAYVMLYAFDGHAFPIDGDILAHLISAGAVEDESTVEDGQRFVEHHLKAEECYDLYACLRRVSPEDVAKRKKAK